MGELGHREEPRYDLRWNSETSRKIKQGTTRSHLHGKSLQSLYGQGYRRASVAAARSRTGPLLAGGQVTVVAGMKTGVCSEHSRAVQSLDRTPEIPVTSLTGERRSVQTATSRRRF